MQAMEVAIHTFAWNDQTQEAFERLKNVLVTPPIFTFCGVN